MENEVGTKENMFLEAAAPKKGGKSGGVVEDRDAPPQETGEVKVATIKEDGAVKDLLGPQTTDEMYSNENEELVDESDKQPGSNPNYYEPHLQC